MDKGNNKQDNIKLVFSIISLLLMIPPLISGDTSYYRTLFIFLINRVIDMFYGKKNDENIFFIVWSLFNQWFGVIACSLAFCSLSPDFLDVCAGYSDKINNALFVAALSCVLKEMLAQIVRSVKEQMVKDKIRGDVGQLKGDQS